MKINKFVGVGCLFTVFLHGMEKDCNKKAAHDSAIIELAKIRSLRYLDDKVDVIIVGRNEQQMQLGDPLHDAVIGAMYRSGSNIIYLPRGLNNQPFDYSYARNRQSVIKSHMYLSKVIHIVEPCLGQELYWCAQENREINGYVYEVMRKSKRDNNLSGSFEFRGNDAFEEAKKDLFLCYHKALIYFAHNNMARNIAFLPLGMAVGFPWKEAVKIAVDSICNYIEKRPHDYDRIWLCVMKTSDDNYYDEIYQYYEQLLCEHQDSMLLHYMEKKLLDNHFFMNKTK